MPPSKPKTANQLLRMRKILDNSAAEVGARKRKRAQGRGAPSDKAPKLDDIDDKIAALERELEESSSGESIGEVSSDSESEREEIEAAPVGRANKAKLVSSLCSERIQPLPKHLLPAAGCGTPKEMNGRKKPRKAPQREPGLDDEVKALLQGYEARSGEGIPFYCRVCRFQGSSLEDLKRHKQEPLHKEACRKERKLSSCSVCKKEFTSPPQLQEHLAGKAHKERMQAVLTKQGKWTAAQGGGGGASATRPSAAGGGHRQPRRQEWESESGASRYSRSDSGGGGRGGRSGGPHVGATANGSGSRGGRVGGDKGAARRKKPGGGKIRGRAPS